MDTIYVVDDSDTVLSIVSHALDQYYRVMTIPSAAKMFTLLEKIKPSLILLDIEMPEMNGLDAIKKLKSLKGFDDIPVIFLTGRSDAATEAYGFELGAQDFMAKPFSEPVLLNRIKLHLHVDSIVRDRTARLQQIQDGIVGVLAGVVENRDKLTGGHIERTSEYVRLLMNAMNERGVYANKMKALDVDIAASAARLHDLGKIKIPDEILNKPAKLTTEEFEQIKAHPAMGVQVIDQLISKVGDEEFLNHARLFALHHHERWDGKGYPAGLSGKDIPLQGRIMAVCDVYDALTSKRSYKDSLSNDEAVRIIMSEAGKQFDPEIAKVFFEIQDEFNIVRMSTHGQSDIP